MEKVDEDGGEALCYEVFCNSLIFRKIQSSLSGKDMMNPRAVSRIMNEMVLTDSKLVYETVLVLNKSVLKDPCFKTLSFLPKNLEICPFKLTDSEEEPLITEIGSRVCKLAETCDSLFVWNVEDKNRRTDFLDIEVIPVPPPDWPEEELDNIIVPAHCPPILQVVLATQNLKEIRFAQAAELFLTSTDQTNCFRELKCIEFSGAESTFFVPQLFLEIKGLEYIRGLDIRDIVDEYSQYSINLSRVHEMLKNNQETLFEFDENEIGNWSQEIRAISSTGFLTNLIFPKWKSLSIAISPNESEDVITFLETHAPQLESLSLVVGCGEALQVLYKCKEKLKHIGLTSAVVIGASLTNEHCGAIKEIPLHTVCLHAHCCLCSRRENRDVIRRRIDLLDLLPSSLQEFEQWHHFFDRNLYREVYDPSKLKNFPELTVLRLVHLDEVTDVFVRAICKYLHRLEILKLISLKRLTDRAFVPNGDIIEVGVRCARRPPISYLKALKSLTLESMPQLTCRTALLGIKSLSLKKLRFSATKLNEISFFAMMMQNPSLEELHCPIPEVDLKDVKTLFPKLRVHNI